jgi:hypothetical protein
MVFLSGFFSWFDISHFVADVCLGWTVSTFFFTVAACYAVEICHDIFMPQA